MTGFTKGPWRATEGGWQPWEGAIDISSNNGTIAYTTSGDNEKANAHLIAAAPELYEVIDRLVNWVCSEHGMTDRVNDAIEALAKARGETPA